MTIKKTTIQISEKLKNRLLKLRMTPRESYEEIISRILNIYDKAKQRTSKMEKQNKERQRNNRIKSRDIK